MKDPTTSTGRGREKGINIPVQRGVFTYNINTRAQSTEAIRLEEVIPSSPLPPPGDRERPEGRKREETGRLLSLRLRFFPADLIAGRELLRLREERARSASVVVY